MATSGAGSVVNPANWALRLADGRYMVQADPSIQGIDPRATAEQFGPMISALNSTTGRWEATLPMNDALVPGAYRLIARGSQQNAAGRRLDGNGDGVPYEDLAFDFIVPIAGDFNRDGVVAAADLQVWSSSVGVSAAGDADWDGDTDGSDFLTWQRNLGQQFVPSAATTSLSALSPSAAGKEPAIDVPRTAIRRSLRGPFALTSYRETPPIGTSVVARDGPFAQSPGTGIARRSE